MGYKSDIEIAQECQMLPITEIAKKAGIDDEYLEQYGKYKAKIDYKLLKDSDRKDGKLILVTAMNPTPAGEGKTTVSIGLAQGAFERAVRYAKQRTAFGRPITDFQAVNFKLAEMAEKIEIARCMCYTVAKMADSGVSFSKEAAMSKLFASQMADDVTRDAIQVMGANGISEEYEVERFFRDTKMMTIGEGTSEILDLVIGRHVLDEND